MAITTNITPDTTKKVFLFFLFLVLLYVSFRIVKPYLIALFVSIILAYLLYPLHKRFSKYIKNPSLSAGLFIAIALLIIVLVTFFLANALIDDAVNLYQNIRTIDIESFSQHINTFFGGHNIDLNTYIKGSISSLLTFTLDQLADLVSELPQKAIALVISIFFLFYLLRDGEDIANRVKQVIPLKPREKAILFERLETVLKATIFGLILTALVQGVIATIGFYLFHVSSPIFFGVMVAIAATLPYIGTALVWLPLAIYMIANGDVANGVGLLLYGTLLIGTADNLLRPLIISKRSQLHPIITLLGVLGGLLLFGFIGVIIGPVILAVFITIIEFYVEEYEA